MTKDIVAEFAAAQKRLLEEKTRLENRLAEIEATLVGQTLPAAEAPQAHSPRSRKGRNNPISLREAVLQVTAHTPLSKPEIITAVHKLGYRFKAAKPINSLNVVLYGKPSRFKKVNGRFAPI